MEVTEEVMAADAKWDNIYDSDENSQDVSLDNIDMPSQTRDPIIKKDKNNEEKIEEMAEDMHH